MKLLLLAGTPSSTVSKLTASVSRLGWDHFLGPSSVPCGDSFFLKQRYFAWQELIFPRIFFTPISQSGWTVKSSSHKWNKTRSTTHITDQRWCPCWPCVLPAWLGQWCTLFAKTITLLRNFHVLSVCSLSRHPVYF